MRWPFGSSTPNDDDDDDSASSRPPKAPSTPESKSSWARALTTPPWHHITSPDTVVSTALLTSTILLGLRFYRSYLRRIPEAARISGSFWRRRSLFGTVTSVGDGDGFRLFHTPGGRLAGWGWLRRVPKGRELKDRTISVRIAGVDAPEAAHFGRPAQPGSHEALAWLTDYVHHRRVRTYVYKRDQYDRAVGSVYVRRWLWRRDVGLQMLRRGLATVYEAKSGAEFGELEDRYRRVEEVARRKGVGIWGAKGFETPRAFKSRTAG